MTMTPKQIEFLQKIEKLDATITNLLCSYVADKTIGERITQETSRILFLLGECKKFKWNDVTNKWLEFIENQYI